jgi:hypothetical protein
MPLVSDPDATVYIPQNFLAFPPHRLLRQRYHADLLCLSRPGPMTPSPLSGVLGWGMIPCPHCISDTPRDR